MAKCDGQEQFLTTTPSYDVNMDEIKNWLGMIGGDQAPWLPKMPVSTSMLRLQIIDVYELQWLS
ncbi:hypothetical protein H2198_002630 [Neophaeococcomyces mojaviensis]|uniref:Uncharacterized protein n=1 Tax=Neophaeococcomyces mojaviensis TaxID=3383035 RepID=A0ACC3ADN3_9EURO|nr:hypothetical protein H2198_002630 [Knufia sp. JES_112]